MERDKEFEERFMKQVKIAMEQYEFYPEPDDRCELNPRGTVTESHEETDGSVVIDQIDMLSYDF